MSNIVRPNPKMDSIVKDSGVLLENFKEKYDEAKSYDELISVFLAEMDTENYLGITRGGTSSSLENETRVIEYDGRRVRSKGDFVVDSSSPQISTTLLLHTVDNMSRAMPMSDVTTDSSGKTIIRPRLGTPRDSDYMESLSWVREMGNGDIKIITLFNAINTESPQETGEDKSESEMAVIFTANAASFADTEYAPMEEIIWKKKEITP